MVLCWGLRKVARPIRFVRVFFEGSSKSIMGSERATSFAIVLVAY